MTENEAKEILLQIAYDGEYPIGSSEAFSIAIQALEEIQQYRALEEKLNGISVEQVVDGFISTVEKETQEGYERGRILTNKEADEWNELQAIGTIDEFKALKEKECKCEDCAGCTNWKCDCYNIRAKAIDEFVERLKSDEFQKYNSDMVFETSRDLSYSNCINAFCEYVDKIAEEMRGAE